MVVMLMMLIVNDDSDDDASQTDAPPFKSSSKSAKLLCHCIEPVRQLLKPALHFSLDLDIFLQQNHKQKLSKINKKYLKALGKYLFSWYKRVEWESIHTRYVYFIHEHMLRV